MTILNRLKKAPFCMAIGNVELMHSVFLNTCELEPEKINKKKT